MTTANIRSTETSYQYLVSHGKTFQQTRFLVLHCTSVREAFQMQACVDKEVEYMVYISVVKSLDLSFSQWKVYKYLTGVF